MGFEHEVRIEKNKVDKAVRALREFGERAKEDWVKYRKERLNDPSPLWPGDLMTVGEWAKEELEKDPGGDDVTMLSRVCPFLGPDDVIWPDFNKGGDDPHYRVRHHFKPVDWPEASPTWGKSWSTRQVTKREALVFIQEC
jgi:hypothetical protein